jgi:cell division septal protein FtsQ|tara:strand:- start:511 stop:1173 length:663 start_codon:yes stop_codon:yes gene_type:complete
MKNRLVIAFILLILLSTYKPQKLYLNNTFNIEEIEIEIENNIILKDNEIKINLISLYNKNLIFLKTSNIIKVLQKEDFIKSFEIKKIYPNKIKIKIFEKNPIAILQNNKKKFYLSENIKLINFTDDENFKNLPIVFGNKNDFKVLYKKLKKINFPLETVKSYYLYKSKRWDLKTYKNKIIKLPSNNYTKNLENFMNLRKKNNFDKYTIFDYRINSQLILK